MPDAAADARVEVVDLEKTFPARNGAAVAAVRGVNLSVAPGEVFGVIGESGAGKSTLIRMINLLERPTAGRVIIDGADATALGAADLRALRRRIGMIFQHFNLLASRTVAANVAFPLQLEGRLSAPQIRARVGELLERVGLSAFAAKYPAQLSGGQKQRVAIARALACGPTVLLCDEATSALDPETSHQVLDLLAELNRELGLTILLITHEMDVVRAICDRVAVLEAGRIVEAGDVVDVFLGAEHHVTRRLLRQDDEPVITARTGRTVRLTYRGAAAHDPFLSRIARETGVDFNLLSGRIAQIKGEPYGQLVVALEGERLAEALARFQAAGVTVKDLSA